MINVLIILGCVIRFPLRVLQELVHWPNVMITYKSGRRVRLYMRELTATTNNGTLTKLQWEMIRGRVIYAGLDNIESIYWLR